MAQQLEKLMLEYFIQYFYTGDSFQKFLIAPLAKSWKYTSVLTGMEDPSRNQQKSLTLTFEKSNKVLT